MKGIFTLAFMILTSMFLGAQVPTINGINPLSNSVGKFQKFEAQVDLSATFSNPYDYDQIALSGIFVAPSGKKDTVDGFYMQDFSLNTSTGSLSAANNAGFRIRFAPTETGTWSFSLKVKTAAGESPAVNGSFECTDSSNPGFVRKNTTNYLSFDSGAPYIPVGQNLCWQRSNAYLDYKKWLGSMGAAQSNFMRLWLAHWGLGIEWRNGNGFEGLKRYRQNNAWYIDWLLEECARQGIYMMFCINHHGQVSSNVNPNWSENPYNAANGGPCAQTWNFFDLPAAKNLHKNRLRYIVARWGFSTNVMAWELFNEVSFTDQFTTPSVRDAVRTWHDEMGQYLKKLDARKHLVTTSYGGEEDPELWRLSSMDFTQNHLYAEVDNIEKAVSGKGLDNLSAFGKPTYGGEFGISVGGEGLSNIDPNGIHIHNTMWASAFSGALGAAATWWWDNYVEPRNLYPLFTPLSKVLAKVPLLQGNFKPASARSTGGGGGELSIAPVSDWGQATDNKIVVDETGAITPANARLGRFLYGSSFNTQLRNPPTFEVFLPSGGKFKVLTGSGKGQNPSVAIYLDDKLIKDNPNAAINTTFSIDVPAGPHRIKVDNLGTDWINIGAYQIEGVATSPHNVYAVQSANRDMAAGWVHNAKYNWRYVRDQGIPSTIINGGLTLNEIVDGTYKVSFYDCTTGALTTTLKGLKTQGGKLNFGVPDFLWNLAFIVEKDDSTVPTLEVSLDVSINIYPNPVAIGAVLQVDTRNLPNGEYRIDVFNVSGQLMSQKIINAMGQIEAIPTVGLMPGAYLLRLSQGERATVVRFVAQ